MVKQNVILIGVGRYGNNLVGPKYKNGKIDGKVCAVVDPKIEEISKNDSYNFPNTPRFDSFEKVPNDIINQDTIAEIATVPKTIPNILNELLNKKIKKVIFPKPTAPSLDEFIKMNNQLENNNVQSAITSNWHYSEITKLTKALISKIKDNNAEMPQYQKEVNSLPNDLRIEKVELEYSKKSEKLDIDPPSQELPHALQIIYSTGLDDFQNAKFTMDKEKQSKSRVNLEYHNVSQIEDGIYINSDLQKGDKTEFKRERLLQIYLNDDDPESDITVDYDVDFKDGKCTKPGSVRVDIEKDNSKTKWKKEIKEDNIEVMYKDIFNYFKKGKGDALTMDKYLPIMEQISDVQNKWSKLVNPRQ